MTYCAFLDHFKAAITGLNIGGGKGYGAMQNSENT
jgi:glutamate dehydrogenase/leucine dehydrogenase